MRILRGISEESLDAVKLMLRISAQKRGHAIDVLDMPFFAGAPSDSPSNTPTSERRTPLQMPAKSMITIPVSKSAANRMMGMSEGMSDTGSVERIVNTSKNAISGVVNSSILTSKKDEKPNMDVSRRYALQGRKHCEKGSTSLGDDPYQNPSSSEHSHDFAVSELTNGSHRVGKGFRSQVRASIHLSTIGKLHSQIMPKTQE